MEATPRSSACAPMRQEAIETFATVLQDVHEQYLFMQSALHSATLLPLDSSDRIAGFLDARDELATHMPLLGESLLHALTTGHHTEISELLSRWSTGGFETEAPSRAPSSMNGQSPPQPSRPVAATPTLAEPSAAPHQATETADAIDDTRPTDANEALSAALNKSLDPNTAAGPQPDTTPLPPKQLQGALAVDTDILLSKQVHEALANGAITSEPEAEKSQASRARFVTVPTSNEAVESAERRGLDLSAITKRKEPRQVIAKIYEAPASPLANLNEASLNRLKSGFVGKGFVDHVPDEIAHYFIEDSQLTLPQLDRLDSALKQLSRPPAGTIANFPSYVGALRSFLSEENQDTFADLSKTLTCSVMKVAIAYLRFLQERDVRREFAADTLTLRNTIYDFVRKYDPGFVHGLSSDAVPELETWAETVQLRMNELQSDVEGYCTTLTRLRADSGQAKRERQSKIDQEFNGIERLIKCIAERTQLSVRRAAMEGDRADGSIKPGAPIRNQRRGKKLPKGTHNALVHGVTPKEDEKRRHGDLENISASFKRLLSIGCRTDHPRLLRAADRLKDQLDFTGALQPILQALTESEQLKEIVANEPEDTTDTWPFRAQVTEGKKAFIVGGVPKSKAEQRIKEHFGFREVKWPDTSQSKGKTRLPAVKRGMREGQYDFYIAIENLVGHKWTWLIFDAEAADNVHPLLVSGYGIRAIELELERTLRLHEKPA